MIAVYNAITKTKIMIGQENESHMKKKMNFKAKITH